MVTNNRTNNLAELPTEGAGTDKNSEKIVCPILGTYCLSYSGDLPLGLLFVLLWEPTPGPIVCPVCPMACLIVCPIVRPESHLVSTGTRRLSGVVSF